MAHTGKFATSDECKAKAGSGVSTNGSSEAYINQLCKEIEGFVNSLTREDWSTNFASYKTTATGLLTEIESNYCGYFMIAYDNAGYNSQREAENLMNTCWARFIQAIGLIKNQETVTWMKRQTV
jgi:hypothetical protein